MAMNKLQRASKIYRKDGIYTLVSKSSNFLKRKTCSHLFPRYYSIKSSVLGNHIVNIDNISIDLDNEVFSPEMKRILREKNYEDTEAQLINTYINSDNPTIDLGAGVGYTACLLDNMTDDSTPVIAVEANKSLIPVIERTKSLNQNSFNILYSAYDSSNDTVEFQVAEDFWSSSQYKRENRKQNKITVPSVSLNDIIEKYNLEGPIQLVVDIEGGEHDLFINENSILQDKISQIIFEHHSFTENKLEHYENILMKNGFEFIESKASVHLYQNTRL
jgi:FkbM family methyltransferase